MAKEEITFGVGWGRSLDASGTVDPFKDMEFSMLADELGLESVWPGDSPTNRGPGYDAHIMLTYIASKTERVKLGTAVYLLPLCHPVRLAKQLMTLDNLSRGRVIVGVGPGGEYPKQFEAFGIPVSERGARTNEYMEIMRTLWTEPVADFHGRFFNFDGVIMEPKPVQQPIPIWIGGRPGGIETGPDGQPRFKSRTGAIRRAAILGDGWIPYYMSVESYRDSVEQINAIAREHGRDPSKIAMGLNNFWMIADSHEEAMGKAYGHLRYGQQFSEERVLRYDFLGTAKEIVPRVEEFIAAGCRHFLCKLQSEPEEVPAHMEYLAKEIAPQFR